MRIAVTYENGQIFQHFGHTETFKIYDVEEGKVVHSEVVDTNGSGHGALAGVLNALNADVLICGGIGGGAQIALAAAGIKLFGEILDEVLTKWEEMGYHFASLEELVSSGSREARSFFLTDNQENPVKSAAPTHAAGSQKQARGKLTSFMAISAVIMRANSSATPPIIGRKL